MSDLISRSALKAAFEEDGHLSAYIEEYIDDATAVDAVPVVHARLKETGWDEAWCQWGDCTKCGHSNIIGSKYCNKCGAKLDGGAAG